MKLFGSVTSPFVRKVRIALIEKKVPFEFVMGSASAPGSLVPQFNPLGKIPVIVRDDGRPLYDSPVIVEYADGIGAGPKLIPDEFADRIEVRRWEALGDGITEATVLINHDYRNPADKRQSPEWYEKQNKKIVRGLAAMAGEIGEREFCFGSRFTLADIAAGYALGYLDHAWPQIDWRAPHPNLKRLADRLALRESFRTTSHPVA
jgi:glutathione S-transferase